VDGPALVPGGEQMRQRPTLVLVRGGPRVYDHSYCTPDFTRLTEYAQVVYLDLRGHGRSARGEAAGWSFEQCITEPWMGWVPNPGGHIRRAGSARQRGSDAAEYRKLPHAGILGVDQQNPGPPRR
jgi:pimeloyl-ACP methyl ester carboxylesterase